MTLKRNLTPQREIINRSLLFFAGDSMKFKTLALFMFGLMEGQAKSNMPLQLFPIWGHNENGYIVRLLGVKAEPHECIIRTDLP